MSFLSYSKTNRDRREAAYEKATGSIVAMKLHAATAHQLVKEATELLSVITVGDPELEDWGKAKDWLSSARAYLAAVEGK